MSFKAAAPGAAGKLKKRKSDATAAGAPKAKGVKNAKLLSFEEEDE